MAYGVIGNTTGFGPVILGSSPSRPTKLDKSCGNAGFFYPQRQILQNIEIYYLCSTQVRYEVFMRGLQVPSFIAQNYVEGQGRRTFK